MIAKIACHVFWHLVLPRGDTAIGRMPHCVLSGWLHFAALSRYDRSELTVHLGGEQLQAIAGSCKRAVPLSSSRQHRFGVLGEGRLAFFGSTVDASSSSIYRRLFDFTVPFGSLRPPKRSHLCLKQRQLAHLGEVRVLRAWLARWSHIVGHAQSRI